METIFILNSNVQYSKTLRVAKMTISWLEPNITTVQVG